MCFCLYTTICRSVKHNEWTHTHFNYCDILSTEAKQFQWVYMKCYDYNFILTYIQCFEWQYWSCSFVSMPDLLAVLGNWAPPSLSNAGLLCFTHEKSFNIYCKRLHLCLMPKGREHDWECCYVSKVQLHDIIVKEAINFFVYIYIYG